jgi:integrase
MSSKINQKKLFKEFCQEQNLENNGTKFIQKHISIELNSSWLIHKRKSISPHTFNKALGILKRFNGWLHLKRVTDIGIYTTIPKLKIKPKTTNTRKPFSITEIKAIFTFLDCPNSDNETLNKLAKHYREYTYFLFLTGCRPSEAIGLQPNAIDFNTGLITIQSSLARVRLSNLSAYTRERKSCKCGETKIIPIPPQLSEWLQLRCNSNPDLIFTSPNGSYICDRNYRERFWKQLLNHLGIPYRVPYSTRHTFASHCVAQGIPLTEIAQMLGHKSLTQIAQTYGHSLLSPQLPKYL